MSTPQEESQYDRIKQLKPYGTPGSRLLEIERGRASFGIDDLAQYLYGDEYLERMQRILAIVEAEPLFNKSDLHYKGRMDKFEMGMRKEKRLAQLILQNSWTFEDTSMAEFLIDLPGTFNLHRSMWTKTIRDQGNEEQHKLFLEPTLAYDIIGAYSQTELGHGSNVQGLETTATYIPEDQEFEIHSPTLTASKWWSGGLGRTATHTIVMAQLIIKGKNYGIHPFVMPLRDPKTRETLPGRSIGDIGPKVGFNMVDNGFLLLDHVRIPHNHFLAKFSQIDPSSGAYTKPAHDKLSYGTMTYIRAGIVRSARDVIARAATIAVRYCAVRRQFADKDAPVTEDKKVTETQVLNYSMVQYRLLPIVATAYAFHFTGAAMFEQYETNLQRMKEGDFSMLADTHAFSSALKSFSTITAAGAIEECRRCCGGHGYSMSAGMGSQYADYLPQVTWEGDSYMLTQQSARYLMKVFRQLYLKNKGETDAEVPQKSHTVEYLNAYIQNPERKATFAYSGDLHSVDAWVDAFSYRAAHMVARLVQKRDVERRTWNSLLVEMHRASRAHAQFYLVLNFGEALKNDEKLKSRPAVYRIMQTMFELFACYTMELELADFLVSGYLTQKQGEIVRTKLDELLAIVRPQAVPLVESFKLPDYLLASSLGRSDGDVYTALFDFALKDPINRVIWEPSLKTDEIRAKL